MKIFNSITNRAYSFKAVKRTVAASFLLGFGLAVYTIVAIYPVVAGAYTNLSNKLNPPLIVENTPVVETAVSMEKLDQYTDQEIDKLADKYQRLLQEEARMNAIKRVEAELEAEKEKLREQQLFQ